MGISCPDFAQFHFGVVTKFHDPTESDSLQSFTFQGRGLGHHAGPSTWGHLPKHSCKIPHGANPQTDCAFCQFREVSVRSISDANIKLEYWRIFHRHPGPWREIIFLHRH